MSRLYDGPCFIRAAGGTGPGAGENSIATCIQGIVAEAEGIFRKLGCSCGFAYLFRTHVSSSDRCSKMLDLVVQKEFGAFPITLFNVPCIGSARKVECYRETVAHRCSIEFESNMSHREASALERQHRQKQAKNKAQWGAVDAWEPIAPWQPPKESNVTLSVTFSVRYVFWKYQPAYVVCSTCGGPDTHSVFAPVGGPQFGGGWGAGSVGSGGSRQDVGLRVAAAESQVGPVELLTPETEFWFNALYNSQRAVPRFPSPREDHPD